MPERTIAAFGCSRRESNSTQTGANEISAAALSSGILHFVYSEVSLYFFPVYLCLRKFCLYIILSVPGGMDKTSGECSLC